METALVLVGMSVADVVARRDLVSLAAQRGASVAFLQQGDPSVALELTRLVDLGHDDVVVVGVSLGPLAPAHSWLRRIVADWWRRQAEPVPDVRVATRLLDHLGASALDELVTSTRPITGSEPGLTSAAWEDVSRHRHQVLVCRGPRCTAAGAEDTLRGLVLGMLEERLGDDDVLVVHTGCQFPCNQAPVVSVQPDDVWYGAVDAAAARAVVSEHLVGGRPLESHRLARTSRE